jgi:hypothetical protein
MGRSDREMDSVSESDDGVGGGRVEEMQAVVSDSGATVAPEISGVVAAPVELGLRAALRDSSLEKVVMSDRGTTSTGRRAMPEGWTDHGGCDLNAVGHVTPSPGSHSSYPALGRPIHIALSRMI